MTAVLVALGAAVGAPLRHLAGHHLDRRLPWGILLVNVAGSFLLGMFVALGLSGSSWALLGTGFCGGLTTYSTFAVQTTRLGPRHGALNAVLTLALSLTAATLGFALTP
ncbi:MAG: CrcB family protein [Nocardioides sp.]